MTAATHSIHIDLDPETAFDHIVDPALVPPEIVIDTVHESPFAQKSAVLAGDLAWK